MKIMEVTTGIQFQSEANCIIEFSLEVLEHFYKNRQNKGKSKEVGGQLFAKFHAEHIKIMLATGPNSTDKKGWNWFKPERWMQNFEIRQQFFQGLHFVGDWHTHPESRPKASSLDLASMQDCFIKSNHQLNAFILVIVGQNDFPDGLWVSLHREKDFERLKVINI